MVALSILSLLVLLLVMLSTSTRIAVAAESQSKHQAHAREMAMLALQQALGELQRTAGPDQRVTAASNTVVNAGAGKEQWTGIWNADVTDTDGSDADKAYGEWIRWMVSGNPTSAEGNLQISSKGELAATHQSDWVIMVGNGSVEAKPSDPVPPASIFVAVPKSPIRQPSSGSNLSGHIAWWVGDEGQKVSINAAAPASEYDLEEVKHHLLAVAPRQALESFPAFRGLTFPEGVNFDSWDGMEILTEFELGDADSPKQYFHELTLQSYGLQTNVRDGGLKRDLSQAFGMNPDDFNTSEYATGPGSETPPGITHPVQYVFTDSVDNKLLRGPTWHLLRDYYNLYLPEDETFPTVTQVKNPLGKPTMRSRASYPNSPQLGGFSRNITEIYGNKNVKDDPFLNATVEKGPWQLPTPRPVKGAYSSYANRILIVFSLYATENESDASKLDIQLIMTPIVVLHNPYNIFLEHDKMLLAFGGVPVRFVVESENGESRTGHFSEWGPSSSVNETVRFYIPPCTLQPGELRIYSPDLPAPVPVEREITASPDLFFTGGYTLNMPTLTVDDTGRVRMNLLYQHFTEGSTARHNFAINHFINSWPGDDVDSTNLSNRSQLTLYNAELSIYASEDVTKYTGQDEVERTDYFTPSNLTGTPFPLYTVDYSLKSADVSAKYGYPPFTLGNPLAATHNRHALGDTGERGFYSSMPIWKPTVENVNGWNSVIATGAFNPWAFWGPSQLSSGETHASILNVPLAPLQSIAQMQSANLAIQGQMPSLAIGNSFASPYTERDQRYRQATGRILFDLSYYLNDALWDAYYFSTIAPRMPLSDLDWNSPDSAQKVAQAFIDNSANLPNNRFTLWKDKDQADAVTLARLLDQKSSASSLLTLGSFNINSTSVDAWKAILLGISNPESAILKRNGSWEGLSGSASPKVSRLHPVNETVRGASAYEPAAWQGALSLSEDQAEALAVAIVEQIRSRIQAKGHPFLSLGEFVNRSLSDDQFGLAGVLQAALDNAGINDVYADADFLITPSTWSNADYGKFPFPSNISANGASMASAHINQADLLESIGPFISARSDTFRVRAYGDVVHQETGSALSQAWCEALVQRIPDPVQPGTDASDPDSYLNPAPGASVNNHGRKFKILFFRWLNKDDI